MREENIYIPPKDRKTWHRFRNSTSAFYEAVTDPANTLKTNAELLIQNGDLK
jgi:hypothetical protein